MAVSHRGAISFGMVHIPVGLYTATQDNDIHFNQLCKEDGSRGKYKKACSGCGKEIGAGDIVRGFEYEKGKYVPLTDDDFEEAKSEKDNLPKLQDPPMDVPEGNEHAIWVQPNLACTVKYMMKTESRSLRQPVFQGLREDNRPEECEEDGNGEPIATGKIALSYAARGESRGLVSLV